MKHPTAVRAAMEHDFDLQTSRNVYVPVWRGRAVSGVCVCESAAARSARVRRSVVVSRKKACPSVVPSGRWSAKHSVTRE